jgi:stage III sporulation protein SpoIIIAA
MSEIEFQDDIEKLIDILPAKIKRNITPNSLDDAIEIVLDIGRLPEVRLGNGKIFYLGNDTVTTSELEYIVGQTPEFTTDNRSGVTGTLHRISAIRNRQGKIIGLHAV